MAPLLERAHVRSGAVAARGRFGRVPTRARRVARRGCRVGRVRREGGRFGSGPFFGAIPGGAGNEPPDRTVAQRRQKLLAALVDEVAQRRHRDRPRLRLQFLGNDEGEGDLGLVLFGCVVDDLHVFAGANHASDLQERDVLAVARIVELAVRVTLDDASSAFGPRCFV